MGAFLGKRVVAPDTIVPVGEFESKFAITTGRLTIEFASQMLLPTSQPLHEDPLNSYFVLGNP